MSDSRDLERRLADAASGPDPNAPPLFFVKNGKLRKRKRKSSTKKKKKRMCSPSFSPVPSSVPVSSPSSPVAVPVRGPSSPSLPADAPVWTREYIRWWGVAEDQGPLYQVWYRGFRNPEFEREDSFFEGDEAKDLDWWRFLSRVRAKGHRAKRTTFTGSKCSTLVASLCSPVCQLASVRVAELSSSPPGHTENAPKGSLLPVVRFRSEKACLAMAFLNLVPLSKRARAKFRAKAPSFKGSITELAAAVPNGFSLARRWQGDAPSTVAWLLAQSQGLFIVGDALHCVGVDASRGLVFCSGESRALPFCEGALQRCEMMEPCFLREVLRQ